MWLSKHYSMIVFVRYADDIVLHCESKTQAEAVLQAVRERLDQVKLKLNEEKSRIVYCKDYRRNENHSNVQFGFLGFSFQPRQAHSIREPGTSFTAFTGEISSDNQLKIRSVIREELNWRNTTQTLEDIATTLDAKIRGWINYFSCFGKKRLRRTLIYLEMKLVKWLGRKHKCGRRAAISHLLTYQRQFPKMFYHWQQRYCLNVNELARAV
jgi:hypothetical protein